MPSDATVDTSAGSSAPDPADTRPDPLRGIKRLGYTALGAVMTAMGVWILPYQWDRGELLEAGVGAGLLALGVWTFVAAAVLQRRVESLQKVIDFLSDLA